MTLDTERAIDKELAMTLNFFEKIPFNALLGLTPTLVSEERCEFRMKMKDELVGNWVTGMLHGGAISTAMDVTGGAMAFIATWLRMSEKNIPAHERTKKMSRMSTIDMRIDFLQPGKGKEFISSATLLRAGNKVAVARMELHNEEGVLIAAGTGTYICG